MSPASTTCPAPAELAESADAASDLREGVRIGNAVLPSFVVPVARLADGGRSAEEEFGRVRAQRNLFAEMRAVAYETLAEVPGLKMQGVAADSFEGGLSGGLPLIRSYATEWGTSGGKSPVVPGLIDGGDDDGEIDPESPLADGAAFTIDDVGEDEEWHYSVAAAAVAKQVIDFANEEGRRELDQVIFDVADRGAEKHVGARLVTDAGGSTAAGTNLTGFDTAEGLASAALKAPADLVIVNPADWAKVRRAVAQSWQQNPAPTPAVSMGVPAGTAIVTGRRAFHLFRRDHDVAAETQPAKLGYLVGVGRWFYIAIRNADAIQKVTGV